MVVGIKSWESWKGGPNRQGRRDEVVDRASGETRPRNHKCGIQVPDDWQAKLKVGRGNEDQDGIQ